MAGFNLKTHSRNSIWIDRCRAPRHICQRKVWKHPFHYFWFISSSFALFCLHFQSISFRLCVSLYIYLFSPWTFKSFILILLQRLGKINKLRCLRVKSKPRKTLISSCHSQESFLDFRHFVVIKYTVCDYLLKNLSKSCGKYCKSEYCILTALH